MFSVKRPDAASTGEKPCEIEREARKVFIRVGSGISLVSSGSPYEDFVGEELDKTTASPAVPNNLQQTPS